MRETDLEVCGRPYRAAVAETFLEALLGVHAVSPEVEALAIRGSSVHGLTIRHPIWVFGVGDTGVGTGGRLLRPGRIVRFRGADHVVEIFRRLDCADEHRSHTIRWPG